MFNTTISISIVYFLWQWKAIKGFKYESVAIPMKSWFWVFFPWMGRHCLEEVSLIPRSRPEPRILSVRSSNKSSVFKVQMLLIDNILYVTVHKYQGPIILKQSRFSKSASNIKRPHVFVSNLKTSDPEQKYEEIRPFFVSTFRWKLGTKPYMTKESRTGLIPGD